MPGSLALRFSLLIAWARDGVYTEAGDAKMTWLTLGNHSVGKHCQS